MTTPSTLSPAVAPTDKSFFGHPRGLSTLFFTEMWERFSFYGMRALLILFMVAPASKGGLGFDVAKAGAIYGLYAAMVYLLGLPGGWIADRIIGQRKAVLIGGIVISAGHFSMAVPGLTTFYLGLVLITIGTGLLKPNVSTMVGQLYGTKDVRRDAGFSIFYIGINLGAMISPLICGYLGEEINWHYGFAAAGVGMVLGLIQYSLGARYLGEAGLHPVPATPDENRRQKRYLLFGVLLTLGLAAATGLLVQSGMITISAEQLSNSFGLVLLIFTIVLFGGMLAAPGWSTDERKRIAAILFFFFGATLFWSVFEQAGSTLNLFAADSTNRALPAWMANTFHLPNPYPASWFQTLNSLFIIFPLGPLFAWLWIRLGKHEPSSATKFAVGLLFVGLGFLILMPIAGFKGVSAFWLTMTYFLHTVGELCLSPVGLSTMTKLAPARVAGLMMGVWFYADSVGSYLGGRAATLYESMPLPTLFGTVGAVALGIGLLMFLLVKPMRRLMGDVN